MSLETAIERLKANYELAKKNNYIKDKVAWALYTTWREVEMIEDNKRFEVRGGGRSTGKSFVKCENCMFFKKSADTWKKPCLLHDTLVNCWDRCDELEKRNADQNERR